MLSDLAIESVRDRSLLLRSLPAFSGLEDDTVSLLAEHVRVRRVRSGERLLSLREPIQHVYILLEGSVSWQRKGQATRSLAEQQQVVGWLTLMAREPEGMDAVVEQDALLVQLPAEILEHALEIDFTLIRNMLRMGADSLVKLRGELPVQPARAPRFDIGVRRERRRTMVERVIDMRSLPLFRRGNIEALIDLTRRGQELEVEPGHVFWERGELSQRWVVIEYGKVRCDNRAGQVVDLGAGFVVGIMDAIAQRPRSFRAHAETLVSGNMLELAEFLGVLETHFELARDFVAFMARSVLDGG